MHCIAPLVVLRIMSQWATRSPGQPKAGTTDCAEGGRSEPFDLLAPLGQGSQQIGALNGLH